jgi:hypothetical protein
MGSSDLGTWAPLSLSQTIELFSDAPFRWWIGGGHALELFVGRSWREHSDTDVGLLRDDAPGLRAVLDGWDVQVAAAGELSPWSGAVPRADLHQNNLWCRRSATGEWALDVTVGDGDDTDWIYRRDASLRVPWAHAIVVNAAGVPYLAPELQLLFKSKDLRPKDDLDAHEVIPALDAGRRARLSVVLPADHSWQSLLRAAS